MAASRATKKRGTRVRLTHCLKRMLAYGVGFTILVSDNRTGVQGDFADGLFFSLIGVLALTILGYALACLFYFCLWLYECVSGQDLFAECGCH